MKAFDEVFIDKTKHGVKVQTSEYGEQGEHIIIDQGQSQIAGYTDREEGLFEEVPVVIFGDHTRVVKYVDEPFFLGADGVKVLRSKDENANYKYLYYALKNAKIPNTGYNRHFKWLKEVKINYPDSNKQAEIVDVLDHVSDIISKRETELQTLDRLIKARFVELFGTLHDNEKGFDVVTIEEVCSLIKDGTHQTPQYTEDKEKGYKFLSSKDVMSQKIDWSDIKYIPAGLHEKLYATLKPQRNDILMSKNGVNYGIAAVNDTDEIFDIYVSLALLRPKDTIDPVFFRCVINNPETKRQFDSSIKGIGVPNLHLGEIKKTKIFLPPMELQKEFVDFVQQVDKSKIVWLKAPNIINYTHEKLAPYMYKTYRRNAKWQILNF